MSYSGQISRTQLRGMDRREMVQRFLREGILLNPQALERALELPAQVLEGLLADLKGRGTEVAGEDDLSVVGAGKQGVLSPAELPSEPPLFDTTATQAGTEPVSESRVEYMKYFQNRLDRLSSLVKRHTPFSSSLTIREVKSVQGPTATVGLVFDKAVTSGGYVALAVEDGTGRMRAVVPKGLPLLEVARDIIKDEVIGLTGRYDAQRKIFLTKDVAFPDIEEQRTPLAPRRVCAVFLSDLHYGCSDFMEEAFSNFIEWLHGRYGDKAMRELGAATRYVVLCGDLVEGGEKLLEKYGGLVQKLSGMPANDHIVAIPGEHDTAGILEPQPGFLDETAKILSGVPNLHHGGNPCMVRLAQVPVLLYHGRSMEDWSSALGTDEPCELMKQMMIRRHLAPIYGSNVAIAPMSRDPFLVSNVPRIFQVGHTHLRGVSSYRGVVLLSCSSWKESDREKGSGGACLVDLSTLESTQINFAR